MLKSFQKKKTKAKSWGTQTTLSVKNICCQNNHVVLWSLYHTRHARQISVAKSENAAVARSRNTLLVCCCCCFFVARSRYTLVVVVVVVLLDIYHICHK